MQVAEALDVALASSGYAVAQPVLFGDDLAVKLVLVAFFFRENLVTPFLERAKAALDAPDLAPIEPGGAAGQVGEEAPVMADEDQRAASRGEFGFEPFDGGQIEMIGRFIQQEDVWRGARTRANAVRRASPPDRDSGFSSPCRPSCSNR